MSSALNPMKPRHNPLLWQIVPSPVVGDSSKSFIPTIPIVPENKTNASLRVVLHDTKSALEQFSDRLGHLVNGVEQAKRDIDNVHKSFADGHEKMLDEVNAVVNRSQNGLLEALGSPAQATALAELKCSQASFNNKLDSLESRTDLVLKQLHTISEQQGYILTSLATITPLAPLLKDSPQQQTQTLSLLTTLLQLLQTLPSQIKTSQQEAFESFKTSIEIDRSILLLSPQQLTAALPESRQGQSLKRKYSGQVYMGDADSLSASDPPAKKTTQHRASFIPSSGNLYGKAPHPNGAKNNPLATQSTVPSNINPFRNVLSSSDHSGDSSVVKSTSPMPPSDNIPKECKRQRLEVSTGHPLHKNIPANEKVATTLFPSSNTLKSNTLKRDTPPPQRGVPPICAFTRNKSFSAPAASIDSHPPAAPQRHSANSAPTPHAPGAFLQPRSKVPGLSATSHAFNDTPTPAPRNRLGRLTSRGRTLVVPKSFPPSSPTVACRGMATGVSQSGLAPATNRLADQQCSEGEAERRRNPQDGLDAYTSSDLPPRKQPIRRNSPRRVLLDEGAGENVDIDLDWGDIMLD